jgi:hypothetical protein
MLLVGLELTLSLPGRRAHFIVPLVRGSPPPPYQSLRLVLVTGICARSPR